MASLFDTHFRALHLIPKQNLDLTAALDYEECDAEAEYLASLEADKDVWHDRVQELTAKFVNYAPNAPWNNLQRLAGEVADGAITEAQAIERLNSKKVIIKK